MIFLALCLSIFDRTFRIIYRTLDILSYTIQLYFTVLTLLLPIIIMTNLNYIIELILIYDQLLYFVLNRY